MTAAVFIRLIKKLLTQRTLLQSFRSVTSKPSRIVRAVSVMSYVLFSIAIIRLSG